MKTTAGDILIDTIYDWGVEVVFGLPGDGINGIVESLRKRADKIRFIQVCDEEAAAFMACAYANTLESSVSASPLPARVAFIC
jgi:pyruvate dehydrogenase (quinone)